MKHTPSSFRYILIAFCLTLCMSSFAMPVSDIILEIQKKVVDERLLQETKSIILGGGTLPTAMEKAEIFQKLEEMSVYNSRRQRSIPAVQSYILSQKNRILSTSDVMIESIIDIYTRDKYARFLKMKEYEKALRDQYHQEALALLPEGTQIPIPKESDTYQSILVDLSEQRLYAFEEGILVSVSSVTTGKSGFPTARGDFQVIKKQNHRRLVSPFKDSTQYYNLHVDYWIQFYKGFGIHDACNSKSCWRTEFGGADYVSR